MRLPGQELGCVSVRILPPSREAQWGFCMSDTNMPVVLKVDK